LIDIFAFTFRCHYFRLRFRQLMLSPADFH
jgi:hypothetical protein